MQRTSSRQRAFLQSDNFGMVQAQAARLGQANALHFSLSCPAHIR